MNWRSIYKTVMGMLAMEASTKLTQSTCLNKETRSSEPLVRLESTKIATRIIITLHVAGRDLSTGQQLVSTIQSTISVSISA